jgi:glucose/arabinose dehydrogenase
LLIGSNTDIYNKQPMNKKPISALLVAACAITGLAWFYETNTNSAQSGQLTEASLLPGNPAAAPAMKTVDAYRVFENIPSTQSATVLLDIKKRVSYGGEMGLLGLAFHPDFKKNGFFYVNYTKNNPRETVVSRFTVSPASITKGTPMADPTSEIILFKFNQPYSNHNGGKVLFGPDGMLYIATGDGGSAGDPQNNGQNKSAWLGKILRVDVNKTDKGNYGIPADNPFAGNQSGYREEIYAYGLRNPWRISFDGQGRLWAGDVGQNEIEEIDIVTKGGNYGWRVKEGNADYKRQLAEGSLITPVWQYSHNDGNVSVTGGIVYRGQQHPSLVGKYIYADYASGRVWALTTNGNRATNNTELVSRAGSISAFGEDQKNELYLCDLSGGKILRLVSR